MSDASLLHGRWQMIRAEFAGEAAPDLFVQSTTIEITGDDYVVRFGGKIADRGTVEVNIAGESHTMTLHGTSGQNAGRTIPCIFQIRGDRLRVCFGFGGIAPTAFVTALNDQQYLATYRRA